MNTPRDTTIRAPISQGRSVPLARWRPEVRGLDASSSWWMSLLEAIARVRAPAIAMVIHANCSQVGHPPAARNMPRYAKGRANTVCSKRTAWMNRYALCRPRIGTAMVTGRTLTTCGPPRQPPRGP